MILRAVCKIRLAPPPKIKSLQSYSVVPWFGHVNVTSAGSFVGTVCSLVTLTLTIKMALIAAHLNAGVILVVSV